MKRNLIVLPDGTKLYSGTGTQNAIQSVTVTESVNSGTELTLGSVCCSCLEATIINPGGGLLLNAGDVVQLYKFETDKDLQSLDRCEKVGTFLLEKPVRPTANTLKITAYDFISMLDKDLSDWLLSLDGWPYAVTDFAKMVCGVCGLQANEDTIEALPNGSHPIQKFAVSVTGRKLMEWVGQIGGRFCRADKDGYMEFAWYEPTNISIGIGDSYYMGGSLSYEDYTVSPIEKVQIRLTEDDVGVVAPDGDTAEKNTYIITGNYLLSDSTTAAIQSIAQSLYNQLRAVTYTPLKVTVPLNAGIRAGQIIQVIDRNGKELPTYVMTAVQTGQRIELESTGSHRRDSTTVVNNESLRDLRGRVLTIQKSAEALRIENKELEGRCSALELQVGSITMEVVNDKNGAAASIKISAGEKILVDSSSPRKAFANSAESAVEITGGTVAFNSNTLIVNSTNFTVDATGKITAKDAELSGSMTTVNGSYMSKLTGGDLKMYYGGALYGEFGSAVWAGSGERGIALHAEKDTSFISFSRRVESGDSYNVDFMLNYGVNPAGVEERFIVYSSTRFLAATVFAASVTFDGSNYFNGSIYLANSKYIYGYDTNGNYRVVASVNSNDQLELGGYSLNTYLYGAHVYLGHGNYPTTIRGSSITVSDKASFDASVTFNSSTVHKGSNYFTGSIYLANSKYMYVYDTEGNYRYLAYADGDNNLWLGNTNMPTTLRGRSVEIRNLIDPTLDHHAVPKGYMESYVDNLRHRNYLDNWYFPDAVNQRGAGTYWSEGFTVDRWKLSLWQSSGAYAYPNKSDLTLHNETAQGTACSCYLEQTIDEPARLAGKTVTFSAKLRGVTVAGDPILRIYTDKGVYKSKYIRSSDANSIVTVTATLPTDITSLAVGIGCYASYGGDGSFNIAIESMKLEICGVSTLAYDKPPDKTAQLLECQRYFVRYKNDSSAQFLVGATTGTTVYTTLHLPVPMRGAAGATITGENVNIYPFISGGSVAVTSISGYLTGGRRACIITASHAATNDLPAKTPAAIRLAAGGYIDISCDI